jgi:hypothetical protein
MSRDIVIDEKRDFKGVWIPKRLYLSTKFTPNEKFILIEIYSFSKKGVCYAGNRHFANFTGLKENTVQKMLLKFEKDGYINRSYTYKNGTKEIEKRTITLLDKFYEEFINEKESDNDCNDMDSNPEGVMEKNQGGGGIKVGDKYSSSKCNSSLSDTEVNTSSSKENEVKVYTFQSEKQAEKPSRKKSRNELLEMQRDMIERFNCIVEEAEISNTEIENICNAFSLYMAKYNELTGKVHPILSDETLESIFLTLDNIADDEHDHFKNVAAIENEDSLYSDLEYMVLEHFRRKHPKGTDYHITHFANNGEYLKKLASGIVEY